MGGGRARVPGLPWAPRMSHEAGESFQVALGAASPGEASPDCSARLAEGAGPPCPGKAAGRSAPVWPPLASAATSTSQPRLSLWAWRGPARGWASNREQRKPGPARPSSCGISALRPRTRRLTLTDRPLPAGWGPRAPRGASLGRRDEQSEGGRPSSPRGSRLPPSGTCGRSGSC